MRQLKTHARFGLLMSALALSSAPSAVLAQDSECATNDDCEHGYACEPVGGGCPAVDCAEGSDCKPVECETLLGCVPLSGCEADADCAEGWKCASEERTSCNGGAAEPTCPEGEECVKPDLPPDTPEDCTTETYTQCLPPWMLPCEEAADCGAGFECVERIEMSCSSSGGSAGEPTPSGDPAPDDGSSGFAPPADGDPLPPECMSNPTGEFQCQLVPTDCETDADCPSGLTCQQLPSDSVCNGGGSDPGAGGDTPGEGGAGGADGDADRPAAPEVECETPEPTFACAPPEYFDGYYGWGNYDLDGRGEATAGGDTPDVDNGSDPNANGPGGEEPPAAPVDDDGLESGEGDEAAAGEGMSESSSGCSATSSSRASGSALLMALAVLGLAFRRRSLRA